MTADSTANGDGMIQKYTHDGKLLLQIGTKGVFDTHDGTRNGTPLNAGYTAFIKPAGIGDDTEDVPVAVGSASGQGVDEVAAIIHLLTAESTSGPVNVTSPQPVTNREFTATLAVVSVAGCLAAAAVLWQAGKPLYARLTSMDVEEQRTYRFTLTSYEHPGVLRCTVRQGRLTAQAGRESAGVHPRKRPPKASRRNSTFTPAFARSIRMAASAWSSCWN